MNHPEANNEWTDGDNEKRILQQIPGFSFRCCFGCGILTYKKSFRLNDYQLSSNFLFYKSAGGKYKIDINGNTIHTDSVFNKKSNVIPINEGILKKGVNLFEIQDISFRDIAMQPAMHLLFGKKNEISEYIRTIKQKEIIYIIAIIVFILLSLIVSFSLQRTYLYLFSLFFMISVSIGILEGKLEYLLDSIFVSVWLISVMIFLNFCTFLLFIFYIVPQYQKKSSKIIFISLIITLFSIDFLNWMNNQNLLYSFRELFLSKDYSKYFEYMKLFVMSGLYIYLIKRGKYSVFPFFLVLILYTFFLLKSDLLWNIAICVFLGLEMFQSKKLRINK
ncbi:MAG: hypothetical protein H7A23_12100 [Leptospiraceae bacterium]|nr:hypothetical protein [Leptospiraceae bacterium]MCP5495289.1 hypothetical protein [Leptospiraceae bacterium]